MSQSTEIDGFERLSRLVASEELRKLTDFDKRYPIVLGIFDLSFPKYGIV